MNSPGARRARFPVWAAISATAASSILPRLRETAILQVGWLSRSPYEWSCIMSRSRHDFGVTDADIQALIDDTAGRHTTLDATTLTVLKAAREITDTGAMSGPVFATLQSIMGNEKVVDLTITISFYCAVVRVLATLCKSMSNRNTCRIWSNGRCPAETGATPAAGRLLAQYNPPPE